MHKKPNPLLLVATLAIGCSSIDEKPAPAPKPAEPKSVPALPIAPPKAEPSAAQAEKPAPSAAPTRSERLAAISKEHSDALNAYFEAVQAALHGNENPTPEQIEKVRAEVKEPDAKLYTARAQQILDEDATDLAAFETIRWMIDNVQESATTNSMLGLLEKYHMNRPEMADMCDRLARGNGGALLAKLLADSPHTDVRGRACFATAEGLKNDIQTKEYIDGKSGEELEGMIGYLGAEKVEALKKLDVDATQKQIEALYDRVASEFAEVKLNAGSKRETTLGKRAGAALYEIRHLAVGMPTPEIEGVDLDSVAFKLSDYKGKVVLLDFWGNW